MLFSTVKTYGSYLYARHEESLAPPHRTRFLNGSLNILIPNPIRNITEPLKSDFQYGLGLTHACSNAGTIGPGWYGVRNQRSRVHREDKAPRSRAPDSHQLLRSKPSVVPMNGRRSIAEKVWFSTDKIELRTGWVWGRAERTVKNRTMAISSGARDTQHAEDE